MPSHRQPHLRRAALTGLLLASAVLGACSQDPAILLKVTADAPVEQYDLYIRDDASGEVIFHSGFNPVTVPSDQANGESVMRDITTTPLKIAIKLSKGGKFTLLLVGAVGPLANGVPAPDGQSFWAAHVDIDGADQIDARLLTVPPGDDADRDLWPDVNDFPAHVAEAQTLYAGHLDLLDCDDKMDNPKNESGATVMLPAAKIFPFATETCNDGYDQNCNGDADEPCVDEDGDGDPRGSDCDDKNPARHKPNAKDLFPDPPNCCGYSLGMTGTPDEHKNFWDPANPSPICPAIRCGDGHDNSCRGGAEDSPANDTACVVDEDCDGFPASVDCDDHDANVYPGHIEICGNGRDDSCAGSPDTGCVPCDLDGDGYQRDDTAAGCPDTNNKHPGVIDCNDDDAGVYPGASSGAGNMEAGTTAPQRKIAALKGLCRRVYGPKEVAGTAKIGNGMALAGDADCNGTAFEGCPAASCDADGDGYPANTPTCKTMYPSFGNYDCDDNDATTFPLAPGNCKDGVDHNCDTIPDTCDVDADGDGYKASEDCDDNNANVHPFALEVCNGVDDDCDGDKDEGNPDPAGAPLVAAGAIASCTDDNDGECAKKPGRCVCSPTTPNSMQDKGGNFMKCSGDVAGKANVPHCFGAAQPTKQTCDDALVKDDDCDGRVDDPNGDNLVVKGLPCGINAGVCKPGTVVGCRVTPTKTWYGASPPNGKKHWECSADTVPAALTESCNGFDDDCDGTLPVGEQDPDNDKYIACTGCGGLPLAATLLGCNDCDNATATTHPGASELCNGVDDDCNPATVDGANECGGVGKTCCFATGGACRDLTTDVGYCGACNVTCAGKLFVNFCAASACICKNNGAACGASTWCNGANNGGTCETCNTSAHCGAACTACAVGNVCKTDGSGCTGCNVDSDCDATHPAGTFYCNGGTCLAKKALGTACTAPTNPENADNECLGTAYCTDGVCCDKPPSMCGGCQTCNLNTSGTKGTCANVSAGADPHNVCNADVATCKQANCNGNNSCNASNGTTCSTTPMCIDNATESHTFAYACQAGMCDTGTQTGTNPCGDFKCNGGACRTSCSSDSHCQAGKPYCRVSAGTCHAKKLAGGTCAANNECEGGACIGGHCCGDLARPGSCGAGSAETSCASTNMLTTYTCNAPYTACTSAVTTCAGNYVCKDAVSCDDDCDNDGQCTNNTWCKKGSGAIDTCEARIAAAGACDNANCVVSMCKQCATGAVACPGTNVCP